MVRMGGEKRPKIPKTSLGRASVTLKELTRMEEDLKLKAVKDELNDINQKMVATIRRRRKLLNRIPEAARNAIEGRLKTYCTCEEYDMPHALRRLRVWSRGSAEVLDYGRVIHVRTGSRFEEDSDDESEGDVFVFPYGVVVCWGLTEAQESELLVVLRFVEVESLDEVEEDEFTYTYGNNFKFVNSEDELVLVTPPSSGPDLQRSTLEKLAASHAFSQSAKLCSFSLTIQKAIQDTRGLAAELAELGEIKSVDQRDIARTLGRLILDRHTIYLYADVLDTPEVCWENPDLEPLYHSANRYLELTPRIELLNSRVDVVRELLSLLGDELQNKHASRLEEIIIVLICIEIGFEFVKDVVPLAADWVGKQAMVTALPTVSAATGALVTQRTAQIVLVGAITVVGMLVSTVVFSLLYWWWISVHPIDRVTTFFKTFASRFGKQKKSQTRFRMYNSRWN